MKKRLKYAFMSFSCPELSFQEMLSTAVRYGYSGIEPRISIGHKHGVDLSASLAERKAFKQMTEESGIAICCIATGYTYVDPAKVADNVKLTLEAIRLAADVGCERIRVFGGELKKNVTHAEAMPLLVESLQACADEAQAHGVTICLETHDSWSDAHLAAQVIQAVNHPSIAINWDIAHPLKTGASVEESFRTLLPWIRHVHVHDGFHHADRFELKPMGEGAVDHHKLIQLLQSISYNGYISGEWIDYSKFDIHLPSEIAVMKQYEESYE